VPERFIGLTLGGRYALSRLLGAGAYAWVYEARDTELEIPVAVKVLRPEHTGNEVVGDPLPP
jgi:eukaryotic-like serine/threonine-protein kinase